jgi:AraC-like DNA-binding protein
MLDYYKGEGRDYWGSKRKITHSSVHWHKFYEVELILEGDGTEFINGVPYKVGKGCLTIIPPGSFHSYCASNDKIYITTVCFSSLFLAADIYQKKAIFGNPLLFKLDDIQFENISGWFNIFMNESNSESMNRDDIAKRIIELILLSCPQSCENLIQIAGVPDNRQILLVRTVLNYIDDHYSEKISRDRLADALHYSPCYFSSVFHKLAGITLSEYVSNIRMNKANELICNSDVAISEIIKRVGYRSESLFYTTFRKYFGVNPNELRRKSVF